MIMDLPRKFDKPFAKVENGTLFIYRMMQFEGLMYELTYASKKSKCVYCEKKLKQKHRTLDHRYPRDTGGVSITNNLFPCCQKCNSDKGNLTHEEYLQIRNLDKRGRKKFTKKWQTYNEKTMKKIGYKLPRKWVETEEVSNIFYRHNFDYIKGKTYNKILEFYKKYGKMPRPVVLDRNNLLLDGYNIIVLAQDFGIKKVPVIRLENVEVAITRSYW